MSEEVQQTEEVQKKSLLSRIFGKLISWAVKITIGLVIFYFVMGYLDKRKDEFIQSSIDAAIQKCGGEDACIKNIQKHGEKCVKDNYHQEKSSKKVKKYVLEEETFNGCLNSYK